MATSWFERLLGTLAERGRAWIRVPPGLPPFERARELAHQLVSEKGEASGAALAGALLESYRTLDDADRARFLDCLSVEFAPETGSLSAAASGYLAEPGPDTASRLFAAAEPPRQELLRRMNMAPGGTATLIRLRETVLAALPGNPRLWPLEHDLKHLLTSWFNRGFLELRRIDWHSPAAVLEKLIEYEAVHEIAGWEDLRRRLAADRRCFAFFHPALDDEPLIFVEVALVEGLAAAIAPLLDPARHQDAAAADTAIFYSISNCQKGLRGISFGNFLIKQVVEELQAELPRLERFATLSPVPGFRGWLDRRETDRRLLGEAELLAKLAEDPAALDAPATAAPFEAPLVRLCALYLTEANDGKGPSDPVARFHLRNGARLERIDFRANLTQRGIEESWGLMVNYLYDLDQIEANHEAFVGAGRVAHSSAVTQALREEAGLGVGNLLPFAGSRRGRKPKPA
jgi:malonyl-CoA decarboxylase